MVLTSSLERLESRRRSMLMQCSFAAALSNGAPLIEWPVSTTWTILPMLWQVAHFSCMRLYFVFMSGGKAEVSKVLSLPLVTTVKDAGELAANMRRRETIDTDTAIIFFIISPEC